MEQSEKNICSNDNALADIARVNVEVIARRDYPLAYRNICEALERNFDTALLRWRRSEPPVMDMERASEISGEMLSAITEWQLDDDTLNGYGYIWNVVRYISFLLDRSVDLPNERLLHIRESQNQYADVALDYCILDILDGRNPDGDVPQFLDRLASKKRQQLAVDTYQTYFALLETDRGSSQADALVLQAEANYARRAKDPFYSGGMTFLGGGPDNPYVVDYVLAAILKKIGWQGESIHKWVWGDRVK